MGRHHRFCSRSFLASSIVLLGACTAADIKPDLSPLSAAVGDRAGGDVVLHEVVDPSVFEPILARPLSMADATQVALLASPDLRAKYAELGVAQADLADVLRPPFPVFEAVLRPTDAGQFANLEFNLVQSVLDILSRPARRSAAEKTFEAETLRLAGEVVATVAEVRRAYVDAVATRAKVAARHAQAAATDASVSFAESLHRAGNLSDLELAVRRAEHEDTLSEVAFAELEATDALPDLARRMGVADREPKIPAQLPHPVSVDPAIDGLEETAIERRLDLARLRMEVARARAHLMVVVGWERWPEIEIGATAEREGKDEWAAGPTLSLQFPLLDRSRPAVARATAELAKAESDLRSGEGMIRAEVRAAAAKVKIARQLADRMRGVALPLKRDIVGLTQGEYNFMLVGAFELLDAKRDESAATVVYADALHEYWLARIELARAIGGADLALPMAEEAGS